MVILTIPLIDSSLDVNLYKVHNLPMLHPQLQIQVKYELEGTYFATHMHGMYATIPQGTDIKLCMMSQGHLCMFEEPLYPLIKLTGAYMPFLLTTLRRLKRIVNSPLLLDTLTLLIVLTVIFGLLAL